MEFNPDDMNLRSHRTKRSRTNKSTFSVVNFSVNETREPPEVKTKADDRPPFQLPSDAKEGTVVTPEA